MKKFPCYKIVLFVFIFLKFSACNDPHCDKITYKIRDNFLIVDTFYKSTNTKFPTQISVSIKGSIEQEINFTCKDFSESNQFSFSIQKGEINKVFTNDWYAENAIIEISSNKGISNDGNIQVSVVIR